MLSYKLTSNKILDKVLGSAIAILGGASSSAICTVACTLVFRGIFHKFYHYKDYAIDVLIQELNGRLFL